jgi:hypothetical protein
MYIIKVLRTNVSTWHHLAVILFIEFDVYIELSIEKVSEYNDINIEYNNILS